MNGNYLIPANTKRGKLILGLFQPIDLIILLVGVITSIILIAVLPIERVGFAVLGITPGLVAGFLVLPVAYYHNVRQLITEMFRYLNGRKKFIWKGWCFLDESEHTESKSKFS